MLFEAASWTVKVTALFIELLRVGLENDFVKVYVFPDTFVCVPPLIEMELIQTLSLTTAVNVAVLLEDPLEEYQVREDVFAEKEEIVGDCVSVFVKLIASEAVAELSFISVTVAITLSVLEPNP